MPIWVKALGNKNAASYIEKAKALASFCSFISVPKASAIWFVVNIPDNGLKSFSAMGTLYWPIGSGENNISPGLWFISIMSL